MATKPPDAVSEVAEEGARVVAVVKDCSWISDPEEKYAERNIKHVHLRVCAIYGKSFKGFAKVGEPFSKRLYDPALHRNKRAKNFEFLESSDLIEK